MGLVIIPAGIFGFIALWIYLESVDNLPFSILLGIIGIILGCVLAEYIRRRYGLNSFFSRLHATPDIDGFDPLENENRNEV